MKRYIAKSGQKITIEIERSADVRSRRSQPLNPKGILTARRDEDYQARRLAGGLTIYDLGMIFADGEYHDIDSQLIKPWQNLGGVGTPFTAPLDAADYAARDALALANLATAAQIKPDYTEHIGGFMNFGEDTVLMGEPSAVWSSKGLKVTDAQLAAETVEIGFALGSNTFDRVRFKGEGANKITSVFDYDADPAEFELRKKDKIYLVPLYNRSYLEQSLPDHDGFANVVHKLNSFHFFIPRERLLAGESPFDIESDSLPNARVMRSTQTTFGGVFTNSEQPASIYVGPTNLSISTETTPEGFLVAIVRRGEAMFYVWKN